MKLIFREIYFHKKINILQDSFELKALTSVQV